jgi:SPP1 family predicted phage head-tail adaptor
MRKVIRQWIMKIGSGVTNPGELRTQVVIKSRSVTQDAGGFPVASWATVATVWAKWTNVHGSEAWAALQAQASDAATVLVRYRSGVDTTGAIEKSGVLYEIVSVDDVQNRHEYMEIKVKRMARG